MNKKIQASGIIDDAAAEIEEETQEEINNFKKFAFKGRMIELAVAFMVGGAFQKAVEALSSNLLMPFINFFIAKTGTDWRNLTWTPIDGMTLAAGKCMGSFVDFFLISLILYVIYVKIIQGVFEGIDDDAPTPAPVPAPVPPTKQCVYCKINIAIDATRCPSCTSYVGEPADE
jgi:large conductance mechanosensitive channel